MPRGQQMRMKVPGNMGSMPGGSAALQAALAKQMQQAQAAEQAQAQRAHQEVVNQQTLNTQGPSTTTNNRPQQQKVPEWVKGSERSKSISLYPIYINKEKTMRGGRRVPKELAVFRPEVREMFMILQHAGFEVAYSNNVHPRDTYRAHPSNNGRLHILFKNEEGKPVKPDIAKTKMQLMKYICEKIPLLKHRVNNQNLMKAEQQMAQKQSDVSQNSQNSTKNSESNKQGGQGTPSAQKKQVKKRKNRKR